jgi:hypothetical protein
MPQFTCCGLTFDGEQTYVEHRRKVHGEPPMVRHTCCGIKFYTAEGYREHRQRIHGENVAAGREGLLARLFKRIRS